MTNPTLLSRYAFGTGAASFHICAVYGVVPVVTSRIDGKLYGVVSVNAFEGVDRSLIREESRDFDGEEGVDRVARWKRDWIANVEYIEGRT